MFEVSYFQFLPKIHYMAFKPTSQDAFAQSEIYGEVKDKDIQERY